MQVAHVTLEALRRGVHPGMRNIGNPVELQHDDTAGKRVRNHSLEMFKSPVGVSVARGRNHQAVMLCRLVGCTDVHLPVGLLRLQTTTSESNAGLTQCGYCFGTERVATVCEAHRIGD